MAGFVRRLRAAGFAVDAGREFQLRRVLHEQGADYIGRFEELKYALAPYVATNAGEQKRFYRLWDDYVVSLEEQLVDKKEDAPPAGWRKWAKQLRYLLIGTILILLIWMAWTLAKNKGPVKSEAFVKVELQQEAEARAGQPLQVQNMTLLETAKDSVDFVWSIRDAKTGISLHRQDSFDLHYIIPDSMTGRSLKVVLWAQQVVNENQLGVDTITLAVLCGDPPQVPSLATIPLKVLQGESWDLPVSASQVRSAATSGQSGETNSDVVFRLLINGELLEETPEEYVFSEEGQTKVQFLVQRADDPENCFALSPPRTVQVGSNIPIIPTIPLKKDIPRQILQTGSWLYLLPLLFGLWIYWLHRRKWNKKKEDSREKTDEELAEEYPFHDVGPYVIPYQDQTGQIAVPADFYRIADQLRVREAGLRKTFDGKATIEATVREGGFPSWRERAVKRPANYLVLLRHTDEFQQQDRLLKRLTDFLMSREAELDVYYHSGDFTWFWNEAHPKGWSPAQMNGRYGEHRLIILGDGHGLVDAFYRREPRLEPTKERWLLKWSRRLLLTTEPAVDWSFQEVLLHKDLLLYPATTNGILRGVADLNQVEEYQGSSYPRWKAERFRRNPEPSHRYRTWTTVADHRDYLANDPELFRWLTALSVAPNPNWSLTIAIGRGLGLNVTHDRLLQLSRIPWLAANAPDQDLRLALLAELSVADEQLARTAALEQLEAVSGEVENTFAESEWTANQAVQTFALAPLETGNQAKIRDLRRMGMLTPDQLAELNQVAERQLPTTKKGGGTMGDNSSLDELLNPPTKAGEILNEREKELLGLFIVCLLMFLPMYLYNRAGHELLPGETKSLWQELENPTDDAHRALEKNNQAVIQSNFLDRGNGFMSSKDKKDLLVNRIESALDSALLLKNQQYPLVDSNLAAFQLNRLAYTLNWVAADSALLGPMLNEDINKLLAAADTSITGKFPEDSRFALQRLHAEGIFNWLSFRAVQLTAEDKSGAINPWINALRTKTRIDSLNPAFFDNLLDSMPVNLAYLLTSDPRPTFDFDGQIITGSVVDTTEKPLIGAVVRLGGTNKGTVTDEQGQFALALTRGKPYLEVSWQDATPIEVSLLSPGGNFEPSIDLKQIVLNVPDGTEPPVRPSKEVFGRVLGPNGNGMSGVTVTARLQDVNTKTDQNGYYFLKLEEDPEALVLIFEIGDLRRERNYRLTTGPRVDLGEILLVEQQTSTQSPESLEITLRGRVIDETGAPVSPASVILAGTSIRTTTDYDGNFSIIWDKTTGSIEISYPGFATKRVNLVDTNGKLNRRSLGLIVMVESGNGGQPTEEEKSIERILDGYATNKFNRGLTATWTPAAANSCINSITTILKLKAGKSKFFTGDALITALQEEYGTRVAVGNGPGNTAGGQFLFFGPSIRIPRLRDRIDGLRRNSEALILTTSRFEDPAFKNYPDLAGSTANLTNELRSLGFNVRTILDPTRAQMKAALLKATQEIKDPNSQFLLMFNTYKIGDDIIASDSKYGDPATYLSGREVDAYQNRMANVQHMLVFGNFMKISELPNGVSQQNTGTQQPTAEGATFLASSGVTKGELGLGISYRPTLTVPVTTPGTMVFSVCIDSYGRVTSATFNQERSGKFESDQIQAVGQNASDWRFDISPKGQPDQQCGEVSFVFR